jgi:hypothetical protein
VPDHLPAYALRGAEATITPAHVELITANWAAIQDGA